MGFFVVWIIAALAWWFDVIDGIKAISLAFILTVMLIASVIYRRNVDAALNGEGDPWAKR